MGVTDLLIRLDGGDQNAEEEQNQEDQDLDAQMDEYLRDKTEKAENDDETEDRGEAFDEFLRGGRGQEVEESDDESAEIVEGSGNAVLLPGGATRTSSWAV